jgi:ribonuclease VapC
MIVETSALIAILRDEPESYPFTEAINSDPNVKMSIVNFVETAVVVDAGRDVVASRKLDSLVHVLGIELLPVTLEQGMAARMAYRDFGKGSGHPARLNFGNCFAYALAKELDEPLLFKENNFSQTDVGVGEESR